MILLRLAVASLPRRFRARYGAEILVLYRQRRAAMPRRLAGALLLSRTLLDVLSTAVAERRRSSFLPGNLPEIPARNGDGLVKNLLYDLRHAARAALKRPGYTAIVVSTLALGIGANIAIFTVVNGVLLRPLPFDEPDRLYRVYGRFDPESAFDFPQFELSPPEFIDYREQAETMQSVAAYRGSGVTITADGTEPQRVIAAYVSADFFGLLRTGPNLGRTFTPQEDLPDGEPVVILEHGYWQDRFGGDDSAIGSTLRVNSIERTIIGVMPAGFSHPFPRTRLWLPLGIDPGDDTTRQSHYVSGIARLAPGVSLSVAEAEMQALMAAWKDKYPDIHTGHYLFLRPMHDDLVGSVRPALLTLLGASGFVLLIVCANVGNILLARSEERSREVAIRSALGAQRGRLVQLVLGESLLLATIGGALGVGLAHFGVGALMRLEAGSVPRAGTVSVDVAVLGFALLTTLATTVLFSLAPALHTAAVDLRHNLVEGRSLAGGSPRRLLFRRALVTAEVALAFMLVLGAGLMIRSFGELMRVETGFRSEGVLIAGVSLPESEYPEDEQVTAFYHGLVERVRALPGVVAASASTAVPMWTGNGVWDFEVEGVGNTMPDGTVYNAAFRTANPRYFETIGERLVRGRLFEDTDTLDSEPVAVINETMVRRFFPGEETLGRRIRVKGEENPWMRIVGVVGDVRDNGLGADPSPAYYSATAQTPATIQGSMRFMALVVRTEGSPEALLPSLRQALGEMDPNLPLIAPQSMASIVGESMAGPRFITVLLSLFAGVAMALGASGIYGVLAYSVAQRTREIGIRKALGATASGLVRLVVTQGMVPVLVGLLIGGAGALALGRLMTSLLFGVSPTDMLTFVTVAAALIVVAVIACCAPAIRAARLDPLIALRAE